MIEQLDFPGYFLVVYDIVDVLQGERIYCQGRGSAANSAVCYALGITNVDAVKHELLFERFLAPERDGPPDIDLDIESDRREEVIQHVYDKYGRRAHRPGRQRHLVPAPLGGARHGQGVRVLAGAAGRVEQADRPLGRHGHRRRRRHPRAGVEYANELQTFPRHLGIHSGGMVICDRPVVEVCPVEWARMPGRTVLQWDKDDCAAIGLVKFDLLGLGMLVRAALRVRPDRRAPRPALELHTHPAGRPGGLRHAVPGRLGRGVPGGVPRADGHPAPAASRARSTTWSSRWR